MCLLFFKATKLTILFYDFVLLSSLLLEDWFPNISSSTNIVLSKSRMIFIRANLSHDGCGIKIACSDWEKKVDFLSTPILHFHPAKIKLCILQRNTWIRMETISPYEIALLYLFGGSENLWGAPSAGSGIRGSSEDKRRYEKKVSYDLMGPNCSSFPLLLSSHFCRFLCFCPFLVHWRLK